jgi:hypothetical protein
MFPNVASLIALSSSLVSVSLITRNPQSDGPNAVAATLQTSAQTLNGATLQADDFTAGDTRFRPWPALPLTKVSPIPIIGRTGDIALALS